MSYVSQDFIQTVSPDLPRTSARVAVIFGNTNPALVADITYYAAYLYKSGHIRKVIVTGGVEYNEVPHTEAGLARKILLSYGIPGKHILYDNTSTNVFENVRNARRLLQQHEGKLRREPVLCLGRAYAARRFLMTMAKNWPQAIPCFIGFESFTKPKNQWANCPDIASLLLNDYSKWAAYQAKGHIKQINTRHLVWEIHKINKLCK